MTTATLTAVARGKVNPPCVLLDEDVSCGIRREVPSTFGPDTRGACGHRFLSCLTIHGCFRPAGVFNPDSMVTPGRKPPHSLVVLLLRNGAQLQTDLVCGPGDCQARRVSKRILLGYSHAFLSAAAAHAAAATEKGVDGEVDGMMCIIALQNSAAGAIKVLGKGTKAVQTFRNKAKGLSNVRDMLTHFDAYAVGEGKSQKPLGGEDGPFGWMPMWNSPETILILSRRRGEKVPTSYEVAIQPTLVAVAELVRAASVAMGVEPSPLVKGLTQ